MSSKVFIRICNVKSRSAEQWVATRSAGHQQLKLKGIVITEQQLNRSESGNARNALKSDHGETVISDSVVSKIAGMAASEVDGMSMGGGASQSVGNALSSITGGSSSGSVSQGVSVEVGSEEVAVDLTCTTQYGKPIPQLTEAVRRNVISRIEGLTGLKTTEVNITVSGVYFLSSESL